VGVVTLLTAKQVGKMLSLDEVTIYRLGASGALPCYRLGSRAVRFDEADVVAFLERSRRSNGEWSER
jgi:excisionase family DNA binding protein